MFTGMDLPWYAIKPTASNSYDIALTSKSMAIKHVSTPFVNTGIKVLDLERSKVSGHSPPLPLHTVSTELFKWAQTKVASHLLPKSLLQPGEEIGIIPATFVLLDQTWMISSLDGDVLTCNACNVYEQSDTDKLSLAHVPKVGILNGVIYYLTEECIFIQCCDSSVQSLI
jgi:hypothetical protein